MSRSRKLRPNQWAWDFSRVKEYEIFLDLLKRITPSTPITSTILWINITVFVLMTLSGVSLTNPTADELLRWGANYRPAVQEGEWWRIITSNYVHVGPVHILMNMLCLWYGGRLAESLFGNLPFALIYAASGLGGSLATFFFIPRTVSAGASGAIFGVYGALLCFTLTQKKIFPEGVVKRLSKSFIIFIGYNLITGLISSGINNAAHIGGLLTGFLVAFVLSHQLSFQLPLLINIRGFMYWIQGDTKSAYENFERVIHLDPKDPYSYFYRAQVDFAQRDWAQALFNFQKMRANRSDVPQNVRLYTWICQTRLGQVEVATAGLKNFLEERSLDADENRYRVIAEFLLDRISKEEFLKKMSSGKQAEFSRLQCLFNFYLAIKVQMGGDRDAAQALLKKSIKTQKFLLPEYWSALAEFEYLQFCHNEGQV